MARPVGDAVSVRLERYSFLLGQQPDGDLLQEILERTQMRHDELEAAWCHHVLSDYRILRHDAAGQFVHCYQYLTIHRQLRVEYYIAPGQIRGSIGYSAQNQLERGLDYLHERARIRRPIGD